MARKILLADDSVTAQNMGRKILTDAGYDVITVNNGSAALKRVAEQKPDLIVLDVYMPGYSGLEVCVRLKEAPETARIPILLTVGKLEPFKPEEATRVRADAFIVKPFEASELLSALTRLEDRMVPSQGEGARFSGSVSGVERFSGERYSSDPSMKKSGEDDNDSGWKNRLRFPSKKKKEEAEPEPEPDFVTPSSFRDFRRGNGKAPAGTPQFPLSTAPAAAQEPSVVPDIPRDITPEELDALSELAAKLDGVPTSEEAAPVSEGTAPVAAASEAPTLEAQAPETLAQETVAEVKSDDTKIKAQAAAAAEVQSDSVVAATALPAEAATAPEVVTYKTETAVAQDPAPIDREDEPMFAAVASAPPQDLPVEAPVLHADAAATEASAGAGAPVTAETPVAETPGVEASAEQTVVAAAQSPAEQLEEAKVEDSPVAALEAVTPPAAAGTDGNSPSAEELAEALRFLTPSQTPGMPTTLAEAGAALVKELVGGPRGRWMAEAVALSPEEEASSLEAEMFKTFAPPDREPVAAVSETPAEMPVQAAPITPFEDAPAATMTQSGPPSNFVEPEQSNPSERQSAAEVEEPSTPTTFADAVSREQEQSEVRAGVESVPAAAETLSPATAETETQGNLSSSENGPGGEDTMGKETKGKGGKSGWHQIRSGPPAAAANATEDAKQSEETPKTMAAAASAEGAPDASSIASIVDNVLADLRPKIVEEIARQLAKK